MPIYNAEEYLPQTLDSLKAQDFQDWELLAVDDCSRDKSVAILKEYSRKNPAIQVIQKESNSGSADTRNRAIASANGRYIAFLDADDLWDNDFLSSMLGFMETRKADFAFSSYRIVDENGKEIAKPFLISEKNYNIKDLLLYNRVGLLTAIYDCEKLGKMYFDISLKSLRDDYALWLDILGKTESGWGNPSILASYRVRAGAMTSNKKKVIQAHYTMLRKHTGLNPISALIFTMTHSLMGAKKYYWNQLKK